MPDWICEECGRKTYGWAPKYGHNNCPHCGGELTKVGTTDVSGNADESEKNKAG